MRELAQDASLEQNTPSSWSLFRSGKAQGEVWIAGGKYSVRPYSLRFAQRVQNLLNYYPKGTRFVEGEEPIFKCTYKDFEHLNLCLGVR